MRTADIDIIPSQVNEHQPLRVLGEAPYLSGVNIDPETPLISHLVTAYYQDLEPQAKRLIRRHARRIWLQLEKRSSEAPMDAELAVSQWLLALNRAGLSNVELCRGVFLESGSMQHEDLQQAETHYWLTISGHIFDPTASKHAPASFLFASGCYLTYNQPEAENKQEIFI